MNRTIRSNCFETNSSSTHSITITSKSRTNAGREVKLLVIGGILYPENLSSSIAHHRLNDGYEVTCSTVAEKAALFMHHVKSYFNDGHAEDSGYEDEDETDFLKFVKASLITHCNAEFKDIADTFYCRYNSYSEYGDNYISDMFGYDADADVNKEGAKTNIIRHITNVILNDDMVIIDSDLPN